MRRILYFCAIVSFGCLIWVNTGLYPVSVFVARDFINSESVQLELKQSESSNLQTAVKYLLQHEQDINYYFERLEGYKTLCLLLLSIIFLLAAQLFPSKKKRAMALTNGLN